MKNYFKLLFRNLDYSLLVTYIFLSLFGLVMIYSASQMTAIQSEGQAPDFFYQKQFSNLKVAFVFFFLALVFPFKKLSSKGLLFTLMIGAVALEVLLITTGIGQDDVGSKSWILIGGRTFQPSEYLKLFLIVYFAGVFYNKSKNRESIQNLTVNDISKPVFIWLLMLLLVGLETDLGAVIILFSIAFGLLVSSGMTGKVLVKFGASIFAMGAVLLGALLLVKRDSIFTDSRIGRFTSFRNPFEYSGGSGHQVVNGYYAIGNGGLDGLGLGQSIQKLGYLPHPHTDFIMAIIAEELGIFGVILALGGIGFIVLKALYISVTTKDVLARMLTAGIATWIGVQTIVNVGGLSGLLPLTGVTLPFISYGGTSLFLLSLAMGILINVSTFYKIDKRKR
jgi:cell division protein FtsW